MTASERGLASAAHVPCGRQSLRCPLRGMRCTVLALSLLLATSTGHTQPSAAQKETARGLMAEARDLRERGDLQGALTRFSAADSLMGVPTTGFEMAVTQ